MISSNSIQDLRQIHRNLHTTHAQADRKNVFDYSEETIKQYTRRIKPKSLAFDDQVRVHQHSDDERENDANDEQPGRDHE